MPKARLTSETIQIRFRQKSFITSTPERAQARPLCWREGVVVDLVRDFVREGVEAERRRLVERLDAGGRVHAADAAHVVPEAAVERALAAQVGARLGIGRARQLDQEVVATADGDELRQMPREQRRRAIDDALPQYPGIEPGR